ncbi:hypothetical protein [Paenibacillus sp. LHD-38]|uniref:hypothetical protein n=1 Tax=Paenibacillus sp. LHD-38 TaxID=3072143 RepID=UPI00280CFBEC|nr:hypothetical protein [Paenibacillus sp. LHD-38]MDQ8734461.1 hypothetical protein [Paenibacillus sp. LHD-38]
MSKDKNIVRIKSVQIAGFYLAVALTGCGMKTHEQAKEQTPELGTVQTGRQAGEESGGGIVIPRIDLPDRQPESADMIGLVVYQGRIYTQTDTKIAPEDAVPLVGDKLGQTIGTIDEWSKQDAFATEFASNIGQIDMYTVTGYDPKFRIMSYKQLDNGDVISEFYECLNGIRVYSGKDIFGLLRIDGRIQSAAWESFGSWNYGKEEKQALQSSDTPEISAFLAAVGEAKPIKQEVLQNEGIFDEPDQRFLHLRLTDQSVVTLRLFQNGYVWYSTAHLFLQVEQKSIDRLWQLMPDEASNEK